MLAYSSDVMGGGEALALEHCMNIAAGLDKYGHAYTLLAFDENGLPLGLATSILSYSTFKLQPVLNLHDFFVLEKVRGRGLAFMLLENLEVLAKELGCCKLSLEVLSNNEPAKRCYRRFGFEPYALAEEAGCAEFWQKVIH